MDSTLLSSLPCMLHRRLQCCYPVYKPTIFCPIQVRVRGLLDNFTFDDFSSLQLSPSEVHTLYKAVDCTLTVQNAGPVTATFSRSSANPSRFICQLNTDRREDVNDFIRLPVDFHQTLSGSRFHQVGSQTGDNICADSKLLTINDGFPGLAAVIHDPSQELTSIYERPNTDSSDAYHTAHNYRTLSTDSVASFTERSSISYFNPPVVFLQLHSGTQREHSHRFDPSSISGNERCEPSIDLFHCVSMSLEARCSATPNTFQQLPSLDDPDRSSISLDDEVRELTKPKQYTMCSSRLTQQETELYSVTEEWLQRSPDEMRQSVELIILDSVVDLCSCSQMTFMVYNLKISLRDLKSSKSQIMKITDSTKFSLCCQIISSNKKNVLQTDNQYLHPFATGVDKVQLLMRKGFSHYTNVHVLSSLFLQNSASDKDNDPTVKELSNKSMSSSPTTVHVGQCTEHRPSHHSLSSISSAPQQLHVRCNNSVVSTEECKHVPIEARSSRFSSTSPISHQLQNLPVEFGTRPSAFSVCGVEMDIEEIKSLCDVPLEFTTAEVLCRRAVKSDSVQGENVSLFDRCSLSKTTKKLNSSEETHKRSSILAIRKPDELTSEFRILHTKPSCETEAEQALPTPSRTGRSSLIVLHPPQTHSTRVIDDAPSGHELHELNSKFTGISWASIDSTELSRGFNLINLTRNSSSEMLDNLVGSKEFKLPDLVLRHYPLNAGELQLNLSSTKGMTFGNPRRSSLGQRSSFTKVCQITPAVHNCVMGNASKEGTQRRTASPDSSRFIGLMKKFAAARIRAKSERFPCTGLSQMLNLTTVCYSIPRR